MLHGIHLDAFSCPNQVLFYHSNCKVPGEMIDSVPTSCAHRLTIPGVFALAQIAKEGYPDCESTLLGSQVMLAQLPR